MAARKKSRTPRSKPKTKERLRIDRSYLVALGGRIESLIHEQGYKSAYDFWIEKSDGLFSRASLNFILNGEKDVRITTLRILAECLDISVDELLRFHDPSPRYRATNETLS